MQKFKHVGIYPIYTPDKYKVYDRELRASRPLKISPRHYGLGFCESLVKVNHQKVKLEILYKMDPNLRHSPTRLGITITKGASTFIEWIDWEDSFYLAMYIDKVRHQGELSITDTLSFKAAKPADLRINIGNCNIDIPEALIVKQKEKLIATALEMREINEAWEIAWDNQEDNLQC